MKNKTLYATSFMKTLFNCFNKETWFTNSVKILIETNSSLKLAQLYKYD